MKRNSFVLLLTCFLLLGATLLSPPDDSADNQPKNASDVERAASDDIETAAKESRAAVERFLKEWNTGENAHLRKAVHYPFVSVNYSGRIHVAKTPDEFEAPFDRMRKNQQWDHSTFDKIEPILIAPEKAHYKVAWSRHNTAGQRYVTGEIVYIVAKQEGRWAIVLRSAIWHRRIEPQDQTPR